MLLLGIALVLSFAAVGRAVPSRIIGGHNAPNHKYPHQVSLQYDGDQHFCSGSILNENWILTAAHCINDMDSTDYAISVGTNFLNETGDRYSALFHVVHEKYVNFWHYDIALIRVTKKIAFNDFVKSVPLAESDLSDYTLYVEFAGWGSIELGRPMFNELQEIELKLITPEECRVRHPYITSNNFCTFNKIGEGICKGDSGGPLVIDGIQVGVASYIIPCAVGGPDVYTRVWSYRDWINSTMKRLNQNIERF